MNKSEVIEKVISTAVSSWNTDVILHTIDKYASDIPLSSLNDMLSFSVSKNKYDIFDKCLDLGANPNTYTYEGETILTRLLKNEPGVEYVEKLLQVGADVKVMSVDKSPLHITCKNDIYLDYTRILLRHGADINMHDYIGNSPLHIACKNPNWESNKTAIMLMDMGMDPCDSNARGVSSVDMASYTMNSELVNIIYQKYSMRNRNAFGQPF